MQKEKEMRSTHHTEGLQGRRPLGVNMNLDYSYERSWGEYTKKKHTI